MSDVLYFITQGKRSANGGVASVSNIIQNLCLDVQVVTSRETSVVEEWRDHEIEVTVQRYDQYLEEGGSTRLKSLAQSNLWAYRYVSEMEPSVVHTNDRAAFRACGIGTWLAGVPIVNNIRDTQPLMHGARRIKWLAELALSDRALTLSRDMGARWSKSLSLYSLPEPLEAFFEKKIGFVYSIVDGNRFHPPEGKSNAEVRQELGVSGSPLLAYVASFHPKKKQLPFIENCLPNLIENEPDAQVVFVGDFDPEENNHAAECRDAVAELGLSEHAHFTGYRSDVDRWYQAADITVLASEKEGLARSMIESIACGTPVISFDVASAREVLEEHECGVVISQGDYSGLSQAISELWENEQFRSTMGKNGARVARKLFDPDRVVEEYEALYRKTAQES